jgi:hypothetical protein
LNDLNRSASIKEKITQIHIKRLAESLSRVEIEGQSGTLVPPSTDLIWE